MQVAAVNVNSIWSSTKASDCTGANCPENLAPLKLSKKPNGIEAGLKDKIRKLEFKHIR
jgi:hypothetical protein